MHSIILLRWWPRVISLPPKTAFPCPAQTEACFIDSPQHLHFRLVQALRHKADKKTCAGDASSLRKPIDGFSGRARRGGGRAVSVPGLLILAGAAGLCAGGIGIAVAEHKPRYRKPLENWGSRLIILGFVLLGFAFAQI